MKSSLYAIVAAALAAVPAAAADLSMAEHAAAMSLIKGGVLDLSLGYRDTVGDDHGLTDAATVIGAVRHNTPLTSSFSLQFDLDGEAYFTDGGDVEDARSAFLAGAHASLRDPSRGLIGVFGAVGKGDNESTQDEIEIGWLAGVEGQIYRENFTLYGQAGFGDFESVQGTSETEGFNNGWFVRGVGRWFVHDDAMIEAEASYGFTDNYIDQSDAARFWAWGLKGKKRLGTLESSPVYGVLGYRGTHYDAYEETNWLREQVVYAGLSILFGADNLRMNDRYAATLDMPMMGPRATAVMQGMD